MAEERKRTPNQLRYHRRKWGYSLKDVAFLLGLKDTAMIVRWEKGIEQPSHDNTLSLACIYHTACDILFRDRRDELRIPIHERELALQAIRDKKTV